MCQEQTVGYFPQSSHSIIDPYYYQICGLTKSGTSNSKTLAKPVSTAFNHIVAIFSERIVTKLKKTMEQFSYGIERPSDLLSKLKWDAEKLTRTPHPYDVFNFILTAAVLAEWIQKFYSSASVPEPFSGPKNEVWVLPNMSPQWIVNTHCLPNPRCDFKRHITNVLSICAHTANASKHFHWADRGHITAIGSDPPISNWYQYFFTSREPDIYLDFQGENYGLQQIKGILLQFYAGLIEYLEGLQVPSQSEA